MANWRPILAILVVFFAALSGIMWWNASSKSSTVSEAENLGRAVNSYLSKIGEDCSARYFEFGELNTCLQKLKVKLDTVGNINEKNFQNANSNLNKTGFIILVNNGEKSLDSGEFKLLKNHEVMDGMCEIRGQIDPGYTCKLTFNSKCQTGDVLEVKYGDERAHLKTC